MSTTYILTVQRDLRLHIPRMSIHTVFYPSYLYAWICLCCLEFSYIADASKLERMQQKSVALCFSHFFTHVYYSYSALERFKFRNLRKTRCHLCAFFVILT
jgi:hypothetical protein